MTNSSPAILDILASTFALVSHEGGAATPQYLGTALFTNEQGAFLTAGHVIPSPQVPLFAVLLDHDMEAAGKPRVASIQDVVLDSEVDAATGLVIEPGIIRGLPLNDRPPSVGEDFLVAEYSRSTVVQPETGNLLFSHLEIFKGYVVRTYKSDMRPHAQPTQCYELSVPAIAGASGAPVISFADHTVAGLIVANVSRELLPAQVDRLERPDGAVEETHFYLPHAEAIAYTELFGVLSRRSE